MVEFRANPRAGGRRSSGTERIGIGETFESLRIGVTALNDLKLGFQPVDDPNHSFESRLQQSRGYRSRSVSPWKEEARFARFGHVKLAGAATCKTQSAQLHPNP